MKVNVIYSSLSGCTRRLAQGIFDAVQADEKHLIDLACGAPDTDADVLLIGYWVDKGAPNEPTKGLLSSIAGKTVGIFCTLGYFCEAEYALASLRAGIDLVKAKNTVIGSYVCNGALSPAMIEHMRAAGSHAATPQNEIRWQLFADHPTEAEIALGAERFCERIEMLRQFKDRQLEFTSIV